MKRNILPLLLAAVLCLSACGAQTPPASNAPTQDESFTEVGLLTHELYGVTLTALEPDGLLGYTLRLRLENRSQQDCVFTLDGLSLDGLQVTAFLRVSVPAGLSAVEDVSIIEDPAALGVPSPTDIALALRVSDAAGGVLMPRTVVHYDPRGEANAAHFVREALDTDTVAVDTDAFTLIVTGYRRDRVRGYTAEIYLVNKTAAEITVGISDSTVNGHAIDPYYAITVMAGASFFDEISWNVADMDAAGIVTVARLDFLLSVDEFCGSTQYLEQFVTLTPTE